MDLKNMRGLFLPQVHRIERIDIVIVIEGKIKNMKKRDLKKLCKTIEEFIDANKESNIKEQIIEMYIIARDELDKRKKFRWR